MTITALPTPPSRQDPANFSARGDTFMAALPTFITEANALQADVNSNQVAATSAAATATTKASDAAAARDIAMAAVNYKGPWSTLTGALNVPASVYHSGSIWMLTQNVANVTTVTPGVASVWLNVTPASGLGSAAYQPSTAFQAAIGAISGILRSAGDGSISAATAAQIVAAIGTTYVANATHASSADSADSAISIMDGAVSSAAKIANSIITWAKMAAMSTGKLIGRSTAGGGSPEEISLGSRLTLVSGVLNAVASDVTSVGGNAGVVTNAQLTASVISALAYTPANPANFLSKDVNATLPVGTIITNPVLVMNTGTANLATVSGSSLGIYTGNPGTGLAYVTLSGTWRNITGASTFSQYGGDVGGIWQRIA
jgi:hypothetical protein